MASMLLKKFSTLKSRRGIGGGGEPGTIPNRVTVAFYDWQVLWDQDAPHSDWRGLWDTVCLCLYVKSLPSKQWLILHENLVQMSHNGSEWQSPKTMQQGRLWSEILLIFRKRSMLSILGKSYMRKSLWWKSREK